MSLRAESARAAVFDDPLALSRAHVLAVPMDVYAADVRALFAAPAAGARLLR